MAGALRRFDLLWHTARHLRPAQIVGRLQHVARQRFGRPPDPGPAPPLRGAGGRFEAAIAPPQSLIGPRRARFLNHEGRIETAADWNAPDQTKLWLYNLHYFADLCDEAGPERAAWRDALIQRWIAENPPAAGNGWEPYPTSLRIVNWIKRRLAPGDESRAREPVDRQTHSLALQARHLAANVERHLLGNHLFANGKALTFVGAHFDGPEAQGWLDAGRRILLDELDEQILADGGHFERSPMYHAIITEDLLDLVNLGRAYPGALGALEPRLAALAPAMLDWLDAMSHPDGRIAFFNDAAFAIAAGPAQLDAYARRLGLRSAAAPRAGLTRLEPSGYARLARGAQVALLDMAPVGPDYLPGHAHADTLSFEWSLGGERVVVNGGVSVYGLGAERLRQRGTAAHSTVSVDGEDSSQVWSGFRVARRARVLNAAAEQRADALVAVASHDGYRRLPGRNLHTRRWTMTDAGLSVADAVSGSFREATARFHLGPGVVARLTGDGRAGLLETPGGQRLRWTSTHPARIDASQWNCEFGKSLTTQCLAVALADAEQITQFQLEA